MPILINGSTGITDADGGTVLSTADLASQAQAEAGTDNVTLMTPLRTEQHTVANIIGWGQTWQDVTASRAVSTSYQNLTTRPIMVAIIINGSTSRRYIEVSIDNVTWIPVGVDTSALGGTTFIVPVNYYYRINGSTGLSSWAELR